MMNVRRKLALTVAAAAVTVPVLSSCSAGGFDYATDRPNVIANGGYHISGAVHVLAARIITPAPGQGTFVATISTDADSEAVKLTTISGDGISPAFFNDIEVGTASAVNMYTDGGIPVTGDDVQAGKIVPVTLGFDNGDKITVNAVVVTQCNEYADPAVKIRAGAADEAEAYSCDYPTVPALGE
ncbi:hypothetical protein [Nocardioides sp. Kera G14]|uniref:hypothetical protein n=1 Tax=Nocardioides sp. Kera G14 TaxID=2884264 RepID=UPI001D126622|nr:hypothetical protein [Nocardioides sp. Kera G14]UDY24181.1 hypothetical protein LH076_02470 [Nocardioides sp. Kera G14]